MTKVTLMDKLAIVSFCLLFFVNFTPLLFVNNKDYNTVIDRTSFQFIAIFVYWVNLKCYFVEDEDEEDQQD